jgi:hypothetical protein
MKLVIGWGDMEPAEIERLRKALTQILSLANIHLEGIPQEFRPESDEPPSPEED